MSDDPWNKPRRSDDGLGSLAQSARSSSLKQARVILIVIGVLSLLVNGALFLFAEEMVDSLIKKEREKGMVFDPVKLKEARDELIRLNQMIAAGGACLGAVFIALGVFVYKAPVACTVTGLVLYLAGQAVFAAIDPENLPRGLIVKILIVIGLIKAVQAAIAYEKERKAEKDAARRTADEGLGHSYE